MPFILKSGSLNPLEILGPVQACNGIALLLPVHVILVKLHCCTMFAQTVRLLLEGKEFKVITKVKQNILKLPSKHDNSCVLAINITFCFTFEFENNGMSSINP